MGKLSTPASPNFSQMLPFSFQMAQSSQLHPHYVIPRSRQSSQGLDSVGVVEEERRHVCQICSKAFKRADHLRKHEITHTGEKPFACEHCGKAFNRKENLKTHYKVHFR